MKRNPAQLELFATARPQRRTIRRVFLGWDAPALHTAAKHLLERSRDRHTFDLRHVIVALPVARASRRLLELLVTQASERDRTLFPPRIVTIGLLPDLLVPNHREGASDVVRNIMWAEALRSFPSDELRNVITNPPGRDDWPHWVRLGKLIDALHTDISAGGLSFDQVAENAENLDGFNDKSRWGVLAEVARAYGERIAALGLSDPQLARLEAIARREVRLENDQHEIVLVAVADLHASVRKMLDAIAGQTTSLIHAPENLADRFDAYGCVNSVAWASASIEISDEQLVMTENASQQATAVLHTIASFAGQYTADDITVGVGDPDSVTYLEDALEDASLPARNGAGKPVEQTEPYRFLDAVSRWLAEAQFEHLAALARQPDFERWARDHVLGKWTDWLTALDVFRSERLQESISLETSGAILPLFSAAERLISNLRLDARPLCDWSVRIAELLVQVYGDRGGEPADHVLVEACESIRSLLKEFYQLDRTVVAKITAAQAIALLLDAVQGSPIPDPPERAAIELLGWLELPLDDADALIVTSFNGEFVPTSVIADPFLPDSLRRHLGLIDNERRRARDAFYLSSMLHARRTLRLISARVDTHSDPLTPSRLSLTGAPIEIANRLLNFYRGAATIDPILGRTAPGRTTTDLIVPKPKPLARPIEGLAVTAFRDYLGCPYRFYLKHILRLRRMDDTPVELDARSFGTLAHAVLHDFARATIESELDPEKIGPFLDQRLTQLAAERFGETTFPAVMIQLELIRERLLAFADWQRIWTRKGRRIINAELDVNSAGFEVDGKPFALRGRIDRIDRDEHTGELYVLDYKFSDRAQEPDKVHRKRGEWNDLQLPLYRHLVRSAGFEGKIHLGFINIPRNRHDIDARLAEWTETDLVTADATAVDVIRGVRDEIFWPPAVVPPAFTEAYSEICQVQQFSDLDESDESTEES